MDQFDKVLVAVAVRSILDAVRMPIDQPWYAMAPT